MDPLGLLHTGFGVASLGFGAFVVTLGKGTSLHRRVGRLYVGSMVLLNVTALSIYDLFGYFGPFHVAAIISLATIAAGFYPVRFRRPRTRWMGYHAVFMAWSYVGLLAAAVAEVTTRVPGWHFAWAVIIPTVVIVAVGGVVIHTHVPGIIARLAASKRVV